MAKGSFSFQPGEPVVGIGLVASESLKVGDLVFKIDQTGNGGWRPSTVVSVSDEDGQGSFSSICQVGNFMVNPIDFYYLTLCTAQAI